MLDFKAIKEIRMVDVVGKYGIQLRFRGDYANAPCPLPTHKEGDKSKSFSICISGNWWKCFSESCNTVAKCRGGDVINFVALMDRCTQRAAAEKLSDWFNVGKEKGATRMESRPVQTTNQKTYSESTSSESGVKYMASLEAWYDKESVQGDQESDAGYRKRFLNAIKSKMVESYRAGKAAAKI